MTGEAVLLIVLGGVLLAASVGVVLSKNLFHSVLWLALVLVATAGLFLSLHAEFLAAAQVLLYAGGVVTLVVFAIMLTERLVGETIAQMNRGIGWGALAAAAVFVAIAAVVVPASRQAPGRGAPTTAALGEALLTEWALAFEVLGALLVAALLGALSLARADD